MHIQGARSRLGLLLGLGLVLTRAVIAQESTAIRGRVVDASGAVIVGARITVSGPGRVSHDAVSDARGEFSIAGLQPGQFVVHVQQRHFAPATITVQLSGSAPRHDVRVVLEPAGVAERLTVVGSPYSQPETTAGSKVPVSRRELPNSVSVLTRAQMNDQNMVTAWDALSQMTGVTPLSNTGSHHQFHARGAALELRLDGLPSAQPLSGYQQFDLAVYERVELQRGPTGVLQGAGAFSGAVNLVRRRPSRQASTSAFVSTGTWNNHHAEAQVSGPLAGSLRGLAVVAGTDREFFYERGEDRKWLGYGALEWEPRAGTLLGAMVVRQDDRTPGFSGLPTYADGQFLSVPRSFNPYPAWNQTNWGTTEIGFDGEHRFGPSWALYGKLNRRTQDFRFHDSFPLSGVDRATQALSYERREFTFDYTSDAADTFLNGRFDALASRHEWVVGANRAHFDSVGRGVNSSDDPSMTVRNVGLANPPAVAEPTFRYRSGNASQTVQSGLYTMLRTKLGTRYSTVLGGRWSNFESRTRRVDPSIPTDWVVDGRSTREFTPHAGAVVDVTRAVSIYASYSEIFAAQSQKSVDGGLLDPRIGRQWEVGVKGEHRDKRLLTALSAFQIRDRNRAYPDALNPGFFVPLGEVESRGWEAEITGRPAGEWNLSAGYTWLETAFRKHQTLTGQPLSFWYPKHSLKAWSNWRVPATVLQGLQIGVGVQAYSGSASGTDTRNAAGVITVAARKQGAYGVASLNLSYPLGRTVQLGAQVNNLFDRTYYTRLGGTNTLNWFGEPRNAAIFLRWQR